MNGVTIFIRIVREVFFVYGDSRHHAHALSNGTTKFTYKLSTNDLGFLMKLNN